MANLPERQEHSKQETSEVQFSENTGFANSRRH